MGLVLILASCKSKESSYKQAYEKAKGQAEAEVQVNAPMQVTPVSTTQAVPAGEVNVRTESVSVVSVDGALKPYSVVCGSFSVQVNAEGLKEFLTKEGYKAGIVKNVEKNMFRVIIGSYDTKEAAAAAREAFKAKYPGRPDFQGSWILLNK